MAANYWTSTQRQNWLFTPYELSSLREELEKQSANTKVTQSYPLPDRRLLFIFIKDRIIQLSKRLQFRQQCVSTALVYLHRYFLFNAPQTVNLYLLIATAFYLASKTEESPHHIRLVASEARQAWPEYVPSDPARLGEMEFCLISEMHSQLIVWHPYRTLAALKENQKLALTNEELSLAWSIINDTFMTDLPLTCEPYLIAVTAMFLAVVFVPNGKGPLDLKAPAPDVLSMLDTSRFVSMGGRPGMANMLGQALGDTGMAPAQASNAAATRQNNDQVANGATVKQKTLAAAASSEKMQNIINFLVESGIDIKRMVDATQEIISLYETWEGYNEKTVKDAVTRYIREQHLAS